MPKNHINKAPPVLLVPLMTVVGLLKMPVPTMQLMTRQAEEKKPSRNRSFGASVTMASETVVSMSWFTVGPATRWLTSTGW